MVLGTGGMRGFEMREAAVMTCYVPGVAQKGPVGGQAEVTISAGYRLHGQQAWSKIVMHFGHWTYRQR